MSLALGDTTFNSLGATVYVNLRADSISGSILGSTDPVFMADGFVGYPNFIFSSPVTVTPGTVYYFQPVVQSGDLWGITAYNAYNYSGGTAYSQGAAVPAFDLWFREGIVVPEPSGAFLVLVGIGLVVWCRRKQAS
jgi:hypothetical protein